MAADLGSFRALDPRVMLATSVHAQPGVYALLLGSGVSTGAGIPTGWGVVRDLVRRAAAATSPDDADAPQWAFDDPGSWWAEHGDGQDLGYSNLLGGLASRPAARRDLLSAFFEPTDEDIETGLKVPSPAHRAIAELVKAGYIRVILTTNFDRLTERALEDAGVSPQVVSSVGGLAGMAPLQHAAATVIKLHGDYADLLQRNTVDELESYPPEWDALLDRVLSEYGLVISGWSADWDKALVAAIERLAVRRYPLFWDSRSAKGETAKRLIAQQGATVLPSADADELFTGLLTRVEAVDRLAEAPITTAMAIQRLKRDLPDERRRIDLHDLVMDQCDKVVDLVRDDQAFPQHLSGNNDEFIAGAAQIIERGEGITEPLSRLVIVGIQHDEGKRFDSLWIQCLQRLLRAPRAVDGPFQANISALRRYPALLFLRSAGLASVVFERDSLLVDLLTRPAWRSQFGNDRDVIAAHALADYDVVDGTLVNALPRWQGTRWKFPPSHLLRTAVRQIFNDLLPDDKDYQQAQDDLEFRIAVVQRQTARGYSDQAMPGEFIGDLKWDGPSLLAEKRFRERAEQRHDDWPWGEILGSAEEAEGSLAALLERLRGMRHGG